MQTVTFQCGHCGKLMAVADSSLGKQVRCPHCQQVVVAPPPAMPAPAAPPPENPPLPETVFAPPPLAEHESIFGEPDEGDDLFGAAAPPQIEMPPEPAPLPPPEPLPLQEVASPAPPPLPDVPPPPPLLPVEQTVTYLPPQEPAAAGFGSLSLDSETAPAPPPSGASATVPAPEPAPVEQVPDNLPLPAAQPAAPRPARSGQGGGWLLLVLMSYSILATIALIVIVAMQALVRPPSPLRYLPDEGDHPGATHVGPKGAVYRKSGTNPLLPLSPDLHVALGHSLTVGALRVTPTRVELRKILIQVANYKPDPSTDDCLLLYLDLQNVSTDQAFRPLDPFFDREWHGKFDLNMPYTYLEAGGQRFYGARTFHSPDREGQRKEVIVGQNLDQVLGPGDRMSTFVCTGPDVAPFLAHYHGPMTFRVRVRRGIVDYGDKALSATAVVGVDFTDKDVVRKPPLQG